MDTYCFPKTDLLHVLGTFFASCEVNPLDCSSVTETEILADWVAKFPLDTDNKYTFHDNQMMDFINHWCGVLMDRTLAKMVKDGTLEMMHDGIQFHFRRPKDT